ncbi:MAG: glycosyltransferase [Ruminococcus sp.]|nr:glycosyltransferase [Ruminococcus sp.]
MKLITFTVPCYNSESYMERCIETLLTAGNEAEIIIVNDGSSDGTSEVAHRYEKMYPSMVRVVDKENGGHGSGVNTGLRLARGKYFKVVDSDDWLDVKCLKKLMCNLRRWNEKGITLDLIICNYIYDHLYEPEKTVPMKYDNVFEVGRICTWNDMGVFNPSQYLIMHALYFRTEILRKAGVELPEHMFYVDNIFACQPLHLVKRICYLNLDLYHYFIGREDQSVNESVHIRRIDQQLYITRYILQCVDMRACRACSRKLERYQLRFLSIMMTISSIYLLKIGTPEALQKRRRLWDDVKAYDPDLYYRLRCTTLSGFTMLPGTVGQRIAVEGYELAQKLYSFN